MAKRLFDDSGAWTEAASRATNEAAALFANILNKLEEELGEPVDLRAFHFVASDAIGTFVADTIIRRRLEEYNANPRPKFPEANN